MGDSTMNNIGKNKFGKCGNCEKIQTLCTTDITLTDQN